MRQAGRYMSEYRALRERYSLLELCRTPDLATEVTLQPLRRIDVDAAILFSDLLLPLEPLGITFDFVRGEGPVAKERMKARREAWENGAWVRDAAAAYEAKRQAKAAA